MAKTKIKIDSEPVETPKVEETKTEVKTTASESFPVSNISGRYHSLPFQDGYVVYNPNCIRVSGVISKIAADDMVRNQNQAAHIKG